MRMLHPALAFVFLFFSFPVVSQHCDSLHLKFPDSLASTLLKDSILFDSVQKKALAFHIKGNNLFTDEQQYLEAIPYYKKALCIREFLLENRNKNDPKLLEDIIKGYHNIGSCWLEAKYYKKAEDFHQQCLLTQTEFEEHFKSDSRKAKTLHRLGVTYTNLGEFNKAYNHLDLAIDLYQKAKSRRDSLAWANACNDMGSLHVIWEEPGKVLSFSKRALNICTELEGDNTLRVNALRNISIGYELQDSLTLALEIHKQIEKIGPNTKDLNNLTIIYNKLGKHKESLKTIDKAIDSHSQTAQRATRILLAGNYSNKGKTQAAMQNYVGAFHSFQKSLHFIISNFKSNRDESQNPIISDTLLILDKLVLLEILREKAAALSFSTLDSSLQKAAATYQTAIELIDQMRLDYQDTETKIRFAKFAKSIFEGAIKLHLNSNSHLAFEYAEKSKSFTLLEGVRTNKALNYGGVPDTLINMELALREQISKLEQERVVNKNSLTFGRLLAAQKERQDLLEILKNKYPKYFELKYKTDVVTVNSIQQEMLNEDQALIEYFIGEEQCYAFLIPPTGDVHAFVLPAHPDTLKSIVNQLLKANNSEYRAKKQAIADWSFSLYQMLMKPIKDASPDLPENLVVILDEYISGLPLELLLKERVLQKELETDDHFKIVDKYLISENIFNYCYSATMLWEMQQQELQSSKAHPKVLAFHLDNFENHIAAISKHFRLHALFNNPFLIFLEEKSTKKTLKNEGGHYQYIHFFTHGILDDEKPNNSYFKLRPSANGEDTSLYLNELYSLPLKTKMIITSACKAGTGRLYKGEGRMSMARGFAYAGAESIITTLWEVEEDKTSKLIALFYKHLKASGRKGRKDKALQSAKLEYLEKYPNSSNPYYWAAFIPIGNMERIKIPPAIPMWFYLLFGTGSFLLLWWIVRRRKRSSVEHQ